MPAIGVRGTEDVWENSVASHEKFRTPEHALVEGFEMQAPRHFSWLARLTASAFGLAFLALAFPIAASAAAYSVTISGSASVNDDTVLGSAQTNVECQSWTATALDFPGGTKTLPGGKTASVTFAAPDRDGTYHIKFVCTYDDAQLATLSSGAPGLAGVDSPTIFHAAIQTVSTVVAFSVEDDDDSDDSDDSDDNGSGKHRSDGLPDVGGANQELLWVGAGLVATGAGAAFALRRRHADA